MRLIYIGGPIELHREARICTMLDSGGKSRVKRTLQPLSGRAHPANPGAHFAPRR
jgi:hypothetical protein